MYSRICAADTHAAGANLAIKHPALASPEARAQIAVCSASGIHAISIPPYIVAMVVNLYYNIQASVVITKVRCSSAPGEGHMREGTITWKGRRQVDTTAV